MAIMTGRSTRTPRSPKIGPPQRLLLSIDEVADVLGVSPSTVYGMMRTGTLPYIRIGGRRKVPVDAVDRLAREGAADFRQAVANRMPPPRR